LSVQKTEQVIKKYGANEMTENKLTNPVPKWLNGFLPLLSILLGSGALWLAWIRYQNILNGTEFLWYAWIQPVGLVLVGVLCIATTILFLSDKASAWAVFKTAMSIIPLILFINFVILLFRVGQSMIQGKAISFISGLYVSPANKVILAVVVIMILLSIIKETKQKN
jgi:hypothetical protein